MDKQFFTSGMFSGFQYENNLNDRQGNNNINNGSSKKGDEDLVIEENTIYEIDRECYDRFKRQKRRKTQDKKNI